MSVMFLLERTLRFSAESRPLSSEVDDMKMQNQNRNQVPEADRSQKTVVPKVRYHPSIKTPTPGAEPRTSQTQKRRPAAAHPPQTVDRTPQTVDRTPQTVDRTPQTVDRTPQTVERTPQTVERTPQTVDRTPQVNPAVRGQQSAENPVHGAAAAPDTAPLSLEPAPLGLGVQLERRVVEEVEVLTRGQRTNQDWFTWRKNRITASVAHGISHCRFVNGKSKTPPSCYLAAITGKGPSMQTRAMSWGVHMEAKVVRRYQVQFNTPGVTLTVSHFKKFLQVNQHVSVLQTLKSSALSRCVSVQDCGLFIDTRRPWLAASPDGIVTDSQTGQWLLCLEVKCPYKHRHRRVEDACRDDPAFCLEMQDEDGREPGEIQVQLAVTGLLQADLAVFTLKETAVVPVTFDPDLWEDTVSKLEKFYRDAVLPHLRENKRRETAASWTPEL
ncbi:uncharacterized protein LOC115017578 isoform X2 [Cottoperca gobio]|uniref:Uncharacterized protein LOC115017578 isoform X2 n=1 Tax=Cottoperca gobio TaxID=56716 RepID=A0A6J2QTV0_COTGO|nr:uncharacterized protein LOC115017578 isoform X2 [Cottoperca gobio]